MLVSVCTIARNEEEYLPHLLEDITKQDYPAEQIEVVMVDSSSTDGTRRIMERFAEENYEELKKIRSIITALLRKIRGTIRHPDGIRQSVVQPEILLSVWTHMGAFRRILFPRTWNAWKVENMSPGDQDRIFRRRTHRGRDFY